MLDAITPNQDTHTLGTALSSIKAGRSDRKFHLLLGATGSVATIKLPLILRALSKHHRALSIRVILTSSACRFLAGQSKEQPAVSSLSSVDGVDGVYQDKDEWGRGGDGGDAWRRGRGILHIELRKWADLMVVAPLSANTLAKICNGMCDNLLTSLVRAWDTDASVDGTRKRIVVAPAMNTAMWRHPITTKQIALLEGEWGVNDPDIHHGDHRDNDHSVDLPRDGVDVRRGWFEVLRPIEKELACGDVGEGAMMEWEDIVGVIERRLSME